MYAYLISHLLEIIDTRIYVMFVKLPLYLFIEGTTAATTPSRKYIVFSIRYGTEHISLSVIPLFL